MNVKLDYHVQPNILVARFNNPLRRKIPAFVARNLDQYKSLNLWNELRQIGLIPEPFLKNENRRFGYSNEMSEIWPSSRLPELLVPNLPADILAVASDPIGMLAAEDSAREFAVRLLPWKAVCNFKVVWYFDKNIDRFWGRFGAPVLFACDSVLWSTYDYFGVEHFLDYMPELDQKKIPLSPHVLTCFAAFETWFIASDLRIPIEYPQSIDFSAYNSLADLNNPFEPLMDIWMRGYRIVPVFTDEDPVIRLYARTVAPHELPFHAN